VAPLRVPRQGGPGSPRLSFRGARHATSHVRLTVCTREHRRYILASPTSSSTFHGRSEGGASEGLHLCPELTTSINLECIKAGPEICCLYLASSWCTLLSEDSVGTRSAQVPHKHGFVLSSGGVACSLSLIRASRKTARTHRTLSRARCPSFSRLSTSKVSVNAPLSARRSSMTTLSTRCQRLRRAPVWAGSCGIASLVVTVNSPYFQPARTAFPWWLTILAGSRLYLPRSIAEQIGIRD